MFTRKLKAATQDNFELGIHLIRLSLTYINGEIGKLTLTWSCNKHIGDRCASERKIKVTNYASHQRSKAYLIGIYILSEL